MKVLTQGASDLQLLSPRIFLTKRGTQLIALETSGLQIASYDFQERFSIMLLANGRVVCSTVSSVVLLAIDSLEFTVTWSLALNDMRPMWMRRIPFLRCCDLTNSTPPVVLGVTQSRSLAICAEQLKLFTPGAPVLNLCSACLLGRTVGLIQVASGEEASQLQAVQIRSDRSCVLLNHGFSTFSVDLSCSDVAASMTSITWNDSQVTVLIASNRQIEMVTLSVDSDLSIVNVSSRHLSVDSTLVATSPSFIRESGVRFVYLLQQNGQLLCLTGPSSSSLSLRKCSLPVEQSPSSIVAMPSIQSPDGKIALIQHVNGNAQLLNLEPIFATPDAAAIELPFPSFPGLLMSPFKHVIDADESNIVAVSANGSIHRWCDSVEIAPRFVCHVDAFADVRGFVTSCALSLFPFFPHL